MLNDDALALLDRLAHDLRAPVHNVLALCETLAGGIYGEVSESQREPLRDLETEGRRLQDLVEETLDLVRLAAGRYRMEAAEFSPAISIAKVAARHGAEVTGAPLGPVVQDQAKFERLLDRLVHFCQKEGTPCIQVVAAAPLTLRVTPAPEASFDPLAAPNPLGPPVARALARLLGGDVTLEPGAFVVRLPHARRATTKTGTRARAR
ncbi:MAG TPA: histidine kinase dimerization/phospho-acceptor domain-containing protein [Polyangia bacterium]|nr:histidine kinase dimerization/phospho-acceptor domain-containing protein [Polyangia bacterium]